MRQRVALDPRCPHGRMSERVCNLCQTEKLFGDKFAEKFPKQASNKPSVAEAPETPQVDTPPYKKVIHPVTKSWTKISSR